MTALFRRHAGIVFTLLQKDVKVTYRNPSNVNFCIFSAFLLFGSLSFVWFFARFDVSTYSTSDAYTKLSFQFVCDRSTRFGGGHTAEPPFHCTSYVDPSKPVAHNTFPPSDLVVKFLSNDEAGNNGGKIINTLTSMMMNGLPLVGLDDFVFLSDYTNKYLSSNGLKERILSIPELSDEFGNFLTVREKKLVFVPESGCTQRLVDYLNRTTSVLRELMVETKPSMEAAMDDCCNNVWAVIEVLPPMHDSRMTSNTSLSSCSMSPFVEANSTSDILKILEDLQFGLFDEAEKQYKPSITIRMHPLAIPDTRNIAWTPLKRSIPRQQSGQLLYFTSGFLSLQHEVQHFLLQEQYQINRSQPIFHDNLQDRLLNTSHEYTQVYQIFQNFTSRDTLDDLLNSLSSVLPTTQNVIKFPMYHRAFPTHSFTKVEDNFHVLNQLSVH